MDGPQAPIGDEGWQTHPATLALQADLAALHAEIGNHGSPPPEGSWRQRLYAAEREIERLVGAVARREEQVRLLQAEIARLREIAEDGHDLPQEGIE